MNPSSGTKILLAHYLNISQTHIFAICTLLCAISEQSRFSILIFFIRQKMVFFIGHPVFATCTFVVCHFDQGVDHIILVLVTGPCIFVCRTIDSLTRISIYTSTTHKKELCTCPTMRYTAIQHLAIDTVRK